MHQSSELHQAHTDAEMKARAHKLGMWEFAIPLLRSTAPSEGEAAEASEVILSI